MLTIRPGAAALLVALSAAAAQQPDRGAPAVARSLLTRATRFVALVGSDPAHTALMSDDLTRVQSQSQTGAVVSGADARALGALLATGALQAEPHCHSMLNLWFRVEAPAAEGLYLRVVPWSNHADLVWPAATRPAGMPVPSIPGASAAVPIRLSQSATRALVATVADESSRRCIEHCRQQAAAHAARRVRRAWAPAVIVLLLGLAGLVLWRRAGVAWAALLIAVPLCSAQHTSPDPAGSVTAWISFQVGFTDTIGPELYEGVVPVRLSPTTREGQRIAAGVRECYRTAYMRDAAGKMSIWIRVEDPGASYDAMYSIRSNMMFIRRRPSLHDGGQRRRGSPVGEWVRGRVPPSFRRDLLRALPPPVRQQLEADLRLDRRPWQPSAATIWVTAALLFAVLGLSYAYRDLRGR